RHSCTSGRRIRATCGYPSSTSSAASPSTSTPSRTSRRSSGDRSRCVLDYAEVRGQAVQADRVVLEQRAGEIVRQRCVLRGGQLGDEDPVGNVVELAGATLQQQDAATENGCRLRVSFCGDRPALPAVQARRRAARTERDQRAVILGEKPPRPANVGTLARLSVARGERADGASAQDGDGALVDRRLFGCGCKLALP